MDVHMNDPGREWIGGRRRIRRIVVMMVRMRMIDIGVHVHLPMRPGHAQQCEGQEHAQTTPAAMAGEGAADSGDGGIHGESMTEDRWRNNTKEALDAVCVGTAFARCAIRVSADWSAGMCWMQPSADRKKQKSPFDGAFCTAQSRFGGRLLRRSGPNDCSNWSG